jgi:uncharacterized protein
MLSTLRHSAVLAVLLALFLGSVARADVMSLPMPAQYVVDNAGLIDAETEGRVNSLLRELEQKSGAQVIVLTVPSLEGHPVEEVSLHLAHDVWKLGEKGKDNGVLVLIAAGEKKYRIEVGYGFEATIPDSVAGTIGRECFVPNFRKGEFGRGIHEAVNEIARRIAQDAGVELTGVAAPGPPPRPLRERPLGLLELLLLLGLPFTVILLILFSNRLGIKMYGYSSSSTWWSGRSGGGWSGGGGFGGGGFGGGRGGGFGGGGASGGW